jgi:hypothetical protein
MLVYGKGVISVPDVSNQRIDPFMVEPVTHLDGSPVPSEERSIITSWRGKLGLPGQIALAEGLALLGCFFLPWFSFPATNVPDNQPVQLVSYSGWITAVGPSFSGLRIMLFVHLWLVLIAAVALLILAWMSAQRRVSHRLIVGVLLALSALALLVEIGFYVQVVVLNTLIDGGPGNAHLADVLWGCWFAMLVNVTALAAGVYLLLSSRLHPTPAPAAEK